MPTMLEVEPEVLSKIQARARERGVSVDVYLRKLIDEQELSPKEAAVLVRKSEFACCESGRQAIVPMGHLCQTMQLTAKASTLVEISSGSD
jgi:hypothetical protein